MGADIAVAYIRTSRDERQQRMSPQAQRDAITAWATREGATLAAWYEERLCSVTAVDGRAALTAALAAIRPSGATVLVVAKRDRIARDVVLAAVVERAVASRGARLVSAAGEGDGATAAAGLQRGIVDLFAQYERDVLRERTRAALAAKRARGEMTGRPRYGEQLGEDGVHVEPCAVEQETIERARALHAAGQSLRAIAAALASAGRLSRARRAFVPAAIAAML
jgi:DNA invertase Pin-like site-specific DNA recombinase